MDERLFNHDFKPLDIRGPAAQLPDEFSLCIGKAVAGHLLTSGIETDDAALGIENNYQCAYSIENGGDEITFAVKRFFRALKFGNVEANAMNEPWAAVFAANHLRFAMEPDDSTVTRKDAIGRPQRLAGDKHLGRLCAPTSFVVGMNLPIPANGIFQPFFL